MRWLTENGTRATTHVLAQLGTCPLIYDTKQHPGCDPSGVMIDVGLESVC